MPPFPSFPSTSKKSGISDPPHIIMQTLVCGCSSSSEPTSLSNLFSWLRLHEIWPSLGLPSLPGLKHLPCLSDVPSVTFVTGASSSAPLLVIPLHFFLVTFTLLISLECLLTKFHLLFCFLVSWHMFHYLPQGASICIVGICFQP